MSLLSQSIIKVNKLVGKNKIGQIYVFFGNNLDIGGQNPNELFKTEPTNPAFLDIFDKDELTNIQQNNIVPIFVNQSIHIDDTIGAIKLKIFDAVGKNVSMDEMYLFCLKTEPISPITLYQNLTQNDRIPLTKLGLEQMTTNIYDKTIGNPIDFKIQSELDKKEEQKYSFDDILRLNLLERDYLVASCLGQKFVFANEYPFIVDPYYVADYDPLLERSRKELSSLNNNLLLETGTIFKNSIYLCLAQDVLQGQTQRQDQRFTGYTIKIYYPFLYKANIESIDALDAARDGLIGATNAKLSENMKRTFENIDMFYDIHRFLKNVELEKTFSQNQRDTGITYIKVVMYPDFKINIPVDVIFKLLNASQDSPLIKFNPETKQSNMLRLYTEQLTNDGRKIPFLSRVNIFKIIRVIGKHKSVSVYTTIVYQAIEYHIICEFDETGTILIYSLDTFASPVLLNNVDTIIDNAVSPLIEKIRPFFEQSGLELPVFKSITSSNIEIRELTYQTIYSITKPIDLKSLSGCLSSVFTVESDDLVQNINMKDGASMRFKRVSNFTTLDSQVAFIIEKISKGNTQSEIIADLIEQYHDMNEETANDVFAKTIRDLELVRGVNKRRSIMVKINPGFKTVMVINPITSEIKITVNGINNMLYLDTLPIYIDSFIRITQDKDSTRVSNEEINTLCSGAAVEDVKMDEIVAQAEENIVENEVPIIEADNSARYLSDSSGEAPDNDELFDLLGFEMGSDDDDDTGKGLKLKGGAGSDSESDSEPLVNPPVVNPGPVVTQNKVQDITGMKLKYPNPFSRRIEDRMPNLFVKSKDDKIDLYTRMCPFNLAARRQPIILTTAEKDRLVDENPGGEYKENGVAKESEFIEYGTDPNDSSKKFYFTCPRFWCLKTNTAVTEKEIKEGKCGPPVKNIEDVIIPKTADVVPKGKYVYRFYEDDEKNYPGFHKEKMPDGSCIPCCYSKWSTTQMKKRRDICQGDFKKGQEEGEQREEGEEGGEEEQGEQVEQQNKEAQKPMNVEAEMAREIQEGAENYVKGPEKYPLGENRWGFLPVSVQIFLNEINAECKVSKVNMSLKPNQTCLLRRGVENNSSQSFIACIASAMFHEKEGENAILNPGKKGKKKSTNPAEKKPQPPSIKEMKDIIISAIDIDKFITYQNGDLITSFANPTTETEQNVKASNIISEMDTSPTSPRPSPSPSPRSPRQSEEYKFKSGDRVKCNYKGLKKWYPGTIVHRNLNGTYNVVYDKVKVNIQDYSESKLYKKVEATNRSRIKEDSVASLEPDEEAEVAAIKEEEPIKKEDFAFLQRAAEAFENFKLFLSDPKVAIDYTYLWDIVCSKNPLLFPNGINLIILELPEDDSSNNIELVCPTNHYSNDTFDERKKSIFLIKREKWFEPVFSFRNTSGKQVISPTFSESDRKLGDIFKKIIKPTLGSKCRTLLSRQKEYRFKQAPFLNELITHLIKEGYTIDNQVLNFQGKVIGFLVTSSTRKQGFVPCYPSSMNNDYDFVYMTDDIWKSYDETMAFLKEYYKYDANEIDANEIENENENENDELEEEKPKVKSKAECFKDNSFCRVTDGEYGDVVIVGFLTNTNQFIQINEPIPFSNVEDQSVDTISSNDTLIADIKTLTSSNVDNRRIDYIKRINLETNFYNTFRNTIRILFNDYKNSAKRKAIKAECYLKSILYKEQLKRVITLLEDLVADNVDFVDDFDYKNIVDDEIQSCIKNTKENCTSLCKISKTGEHCVIQFPLRNLVSKQSNKEYYFGRMADELIRYNRIKSFIFKPQAYLSFGEVKYNLKDNEIIVLQDMLTPEFFENLIPFEINRYAKYNTYDNVVPTIRQGSNEADYNYMLNADSEPRLPELVTELKEEELAPAKEELAPAKEVLVEAKEEVLAPAKEDKLQCVPSAPKPITNSTYWKKCFPSSFNEVEYSNSPACPLQLVADLIKEFKNEDVTISQIKDKLKSEYSNLTSQFKSTQKIAKLLTILRDENQPFIRDININRDEMTFEKMIDLADFNIVNFDLWLLLNRYEIPSIMISKNDFRQSDNNVMVCWRPENSSLYAIILVPLMNIKPADEFNQYKLITNEIGFKINVAELRDPTRECLVKINTAIQKYATIDYYFENYVSDTVIKPVILDKLVQKQREFIRKNKANILFDVVEPSEDTSFSSNSETAILEIKKKPQKLTKKMVLKGGGKKQTRRSIFSLVF
jgi:hypothetical protein